MITRQETTIEVFGFETESALAPKNFNQKR